MNYNLNRKLRTKEWYEERIKELKEIISEYKSADKLISVKPSSVKTGNIIRCQSKKNQDGIVRVKITEIERKRWEVSSVERTLVEIFSENKQLSGTYYKLYGKILGTRKKCYIEIDSKGSIVIEV